MNYIQNIALYGQYKQYFELSTAALLAAYPIYGAAVDIVVAPATTYQAAAYCSPIAVVAQGRAPDAGDMGARPIYSILCHWCLRGPMTINPYHD